MIIKLKTTIILSILIVVCLVTLTFTTLYCNILPFSTNENLDPPDVSEPLPPSSYPMGVYKNGAVTSNSAPCAQIGNNILKKYGSAVDAAIATLICDGVGCLQNMGIGGGVLMTIYIKSDQKAYSLNARETAPLKATRDMFEKNANLSQFGGLSVAVPGELMGYHEAYRKFGGKAPWKELFSDTIDLCRKGFKVSKHLAASFKNYEKQVKSSPTLADLVLDENGKVPVEGSILKLPRLARTLEIIADEGVSALYNGSLTKGFVQDIQDDGGIITAEDMSSYKVRWEDPHTVALDDGMKLYSAPLPGSGPILAYIMKILDGFISPNMSSNVVTQRITEAFKHAYAMRSDLGDPYFVDVNKIVTELERGDNIALVRSKISDAETRNDLNWYGANFYTKDDHGTANVVTVSPNGDAVAATSTINLVFGSKLVSRSTGIILNNEMDDFSSPSITNYFGVPPSETNFIEPGKRPMSSMCPAVFVDKNGNLRLVIGGAGGTKITTATALASIWNLWFNRTIKEAIDAPRFHHQLLPMQWQYEYGNSKDLVQHMKSLGHDTFRLGPTWRTSVTAVSNSEGKLSNVVDYRRPGEVGGY